MYSWTQRLNAVLTFGMSVLAVLALFIAISGYIQGRHESVVRNESSVAEMVKFTLLRNTQNDQALFSFDFDIDTTPLFHWNTKQIFLYLTASYATDNGARNSSVVIWDRILRYNTEKVVKMSDAFMKYPLIDMGRNLRGKNITFSLGWDLTPFVGAMYKQISPKAFTYVMPREYSRLSGEEREYFSQFNYEGEY